MRNLRLPLTVSCDVVSPLLRRLRVSRRGARSAEGASGLVLRKKEAMALYKKKATEPLRPDIPAAWIDAGVYDLQAALGNSKGVLSPTYLDGPRPILRA